MGKTKRREAKIKERERKAKARKAARREVVREEAKKRKVIAMQERMLSEKPLPFVREEKRESYLAQRNAVLENKMARNLAALEAIAAEMDAEDAERKSLNEKLESMGHQTLEEKVRALSQISKDGLPVSDEIEVEESSEESE